MTHPISTRRISYYALFVLLVFSFAANNHPAAQTEPGSIFLHIRTYNTSLLVPFTTTVPGYASFFLDFDGTDNNPYPSYVVMRPIEPGVYTITQGDVDGGVFYDIMCEDPIVEPVIDLETRSVTVDVQPGEEVDCEFRSLTDDAQPARVVIFKDVVGGDESQEFAFHMNSPWDGYNIPFTVSEAGGSVVMDLYGEFGIYEDEIEGWTLSYACEGDVDWENNYEPEEWGVILFPEPGGEVICTFTNTPDDATVGTITIVKEATPGGLWGWFDFTSTIPGHERFALDNHPDDDYLKEETATEIEAGQYTVTELPDSGWSLTDIQCEGASPSSKRLFRKMAQTSPSRQPSRAMSPSCWMMIVTRLFPIPLP